MPFIQLNSISVLPPHAPHKKGGRWFGRQPEPENKPVDTMPPLLDDITLSIRAKETLALVGPSGSGKSTLLKVIAGLIKPNHGEVLFNELPMLEIPIKERRIGMIFQEQALYETMTSKENIGFYSRLRKEPDQIPQRIRDVSRWMDVNLDQLLSRRPPTLSGGERQKVAIARALARDFDIFLFDEPLTSLDTPMRNHLRVAMHRLFTQHPVTTIYVTHDQQEAMALANRVALLHDGKILQVGSALELLERPYNMFVAGFWGHCNFLTGRIQNGRWQLGQIDHAPPPIRAENGNRLTLGVRPNDFVIDPDGVFEVRIQQVFLYHDRRIQEIHGTIEGQSVIVELPVDINVEQSLTVSAQKLFWFDTKSGIRLKT